MGANDLVLTILFTAVLGYIAGQTLDHFYIGHPANATKAAEFYTISAVELCGVVIGLVLMRFQAGATWADLGLNCRHLAYDLGLGAAAFLAAATPLFLLQALLEHWVDYKQPLIEAVNAHPDGLTFISTTVTALVAAPLFEEFIFRVLLQGWFEGIEVKRRVMRLGLPGEGPAWWPIALSALLFAVMHIGQGARRFPCFSWHSSWAIFISERIESGRRWPRIFCSTAAACCCCGIKSSTSTCLKESLPELRRHPRAETWTRGKVEARELEKKCPTVSGLSVAG